MRCFVPLALGLGAVLGLLATADGARAAPPAPRTSSLSFTRLPGAESCVGLHDLAKAVEARLHREVFVSAARAGLSVGGRIEPAPPPGRWHAVISLSDEKGAALGSRELNSDAADCRALDQQLAFVVALLIDPDAALAPDTGAKVIEPSPPPAPPPPLCPPIMVRVEPAPKPPPTATRSPPVPWTAGVSAGAVFAFGLFPSAGVGMEIRGHVTPPRWPTFEFGGATWASPQARSGQLGATLSLADGFLSVCPVNTASAGVVLAGCAGLRLGAMRAVGFGFDVPYKEERPMLSATVAGRISRRIAGPLLATLGLGLLVPITRQRFSYKTSNDQDLELFRMWPIVAAVDAGLGVEIP